eukprot:429256_1
MRFFVAFNSSPQLVPMSSVQQFIFLCISISQCLASRWSETNIPYSGSSSAIGAFNRSLYLIGGYPRATQLIQYSIDIMTFQSLSNNHSFPYGSNHFWTQQQEMVYMIADTSTLSTFNLVSTVYDSSYATVPFAVESHACLTSSNAYLYLTGGFDSISGEYHNKYQVLQIGTNQWETNPKAMLRPRASHTCIILNDYLYIIGGNDGFNSYLTSIDRVYSIDSFDSINWSSFLSSSPILVTCARAISYANSIYVFGGRDYYGALNSVWIIDTDTSSTSTESMPYAFNSMASIYFEHAVYIFSYNMLLRYTLGSTSNPTAKTNTPSAAPVSSNPTDAPVVTNAPSAAPVTSPTTATNVPTNAPVVTNVPSTEPSTTTNDPVESTMLTSNDATSSPTNSPSPRVRPTLGASGRVIESTAKSTDRDDEEDDDVATDPNHAMQITVILGSKRIVIQNIAKSIGTGEAQNKSQQTNLVIPGLQQNINEHAVHTEIDHQNDDELPVTNEGISDDDGDDDILRVVNQTAGGNVVGNEVIVNGYDTQR